MDTTEIQRIVRKYYEQLYTKKLDDMGEMHKFLESHNLKKLNQEEKHVNRSITTNEIESVIKKLPAKKKKTLDQMSAQVNFINNSKKNTYPSQTIPKNSR